MTPKLDWQTPSRPTRLEYKVTHFRINASLSLPACLCVCVSVTVSCKQHPPNTPLGPPSLWISSLACQAVTALIANLILAFSDVTS